MVILIDWLFDMTWENKDKDGDNFIVVTNGPFLFSCRDAKLYFDMTWENKTSKVVINCRICHEVKTKAEGRMKLVKAKSNLNHPPAIGMIKAAIKSSQDITGIDVIKAISFASNRDWLCTALGSPIKIWEDKDSPLCSWAPQEGRSINSDAKDSRERSLQKTLNRILH